MKTTFPSTQKKSRSLLISCSIFLIIFGCQYSFAQDYDFQQGDDEHNLVVMEAENASVNTEVGTEMWAPTNEPADYSGNGAMMVVADASKPNVTDALNSATLTYNINFIRGGRHYFWARASRTGGGDDSYHAGIDGTILDGGTFINFEEASSDEKQTWVWIHHSGVAAGKCYVDVPSAGVHDFNVYIRENGFRIDKLIITPDSNYIPEDKGPDETLAPNGLRNASSNFDENLFTLSTNMVNEELMVFIAEKEYLQGKLEIVDLQGKVLRKVSINNDSQVSLNVANLQSGMYLVRVQLTDNSVLVKKFVKK